MITSYLPTDSYFGPSQSVGVVVFMPSTDGSGETAFYLKALPNPLQFDEIARKLIEAGYHKPTALVSRRQCHVTTVTEGPSSCTSDGGWQVNVDHPLLHSYHKVLLASREQQNPPCVSGAELTEGGNAALVSDLKIRFHRTIRVPDNGKTHAIPPDMGTFKLFNVGEVLTLPKSVLAKGGAFIREAMWTSFNLRDEHRNSLAVKISVGGVNALTGLAQNRLVSAEEQLEDGRTFSGEALLFPRLRGGRYKGMEAGFAAGGRISQKINHDPLPIATYDHDRVRRFHVSVINAACFSKITGFPNPSSPITPQTYLQLELPWFELYDAHIPSANNTSSPPPLTDVRLFRAEERRRHPQLLRHHKAFSLNFKAVNLCVSRSPSLHGISQRSTRTSKGAACICQVHSNLEHRSVGWIE
ncbi:hypothetical protein PAXINDRAFT_17691 [Paxillus involutus ATCC 200175]|uniref:Uncharacterized protein n=1 Tax=Paxillus involutus ATCC 200175 TaxID=664439 RepID=A0A0C9TE43_PAXIN|nr:hypothetical protein PAXINDRAFT_17691 [Paxillus involutus ATCC 200175]